MTTLYKLYSIARITFKELVRDKILYSSIVLTFLLLLLGYLVSGLTFLKPDRFVLDFGLTCVILVNVFTSTFLASSLIKKEVENRTLFMMLSRPISATSFLFGKFIGLTLVLTLNWLLASIGYLVILQVVEGSITETLLIALFFGFLQAIIAGGISLFFSSFSSSILASVLTIGIYLIGVNLSQLKILATKAPNEVNKLFFSSLAFILPQFESLFLSKEVTYALEVSFDLVLHGIGYTFLMTGFYVLFGSFLFSKKEY